MLNDPYFKNESGALYHGDCLEIMQGIPDDSIDMVLTSPPYDNLRDYHGYTFEFEEVAQQLARIIKEAGVIVWIVNDATIKGSETGTSFRQALYFKDFCGLNLHDTMIWNKGVFTATGSLAIRYAPVFEYMFIFSKGKPNEFNPIKDRQNKHSKVLYHSTVRQKDGTTRDISGKGVKKIKEYGQRHNIWLCFPEQSNLRRCHPAQFPAKLAVDHIRSWSKMRDTILDPFIGSGTTAIAAHQLKRRWIGIEMSEEYCKIAAERIKRETAQMMLDI